nr:DMT family transporter [candidate division Zixibacteria bacterium]
MPNTTPRRFTALAQIGLFYAAAIWGATFYIVKAALDDIDPVIMVGYRFLMAGTVLLIFLAFGKRPLFTGLKRSFLLAVLLYLLYIPQTMGLKYTTASNSGFITGLFVAFVPIFLLTIFKSRPSRTDIIASVVSLGGLWILTGGLRDINPGDMLTLITAMTYALHLLYSDKYMKAGIDPYVISCQQFIMVGLMSLATGLIFDLPFGVGSGAALRTVIFLALLPTLSAFVIQMVAQKIISPVRVSLIFAFEPVFAALFAWTLGGETIITHRAAGGLLIFIALIISALPPTRRARDISRTGA